MVRSARRTRSELDGVGFKSAKDVLIHSIHSAASTNGTTSGPARRQPCASPNSKRARRELRCALRVSWLNDRKSVSCCSACISTQSSLMGSRLSEISSGGRFSRASRPSM